MVELNGFGKPCPQPLVMVKKQIDAGETDVSIKVDNETAVKNITRLAGKKGLGSCWPTAGRRWLPSCPTLWRSPPRTPA